MRKEDESFPSIPSYKAIRWMQHSVLVCELVKSGLLMSYIWLQVHRRFRLARPILEEAYTDAFKVSSRTSSRPKRTLSAGALSAVCRQVSVADSAEDTMPMAKLEAS